jgi:hypothetical protein
VEFLIGHRVSAEVARPSRAKSSNDYTIDSTNNDQLFAAIALCVAAMAPAVLQMPTLCRSRTSCHRSRRFYHPAVVSIETKGRIAPDKSRRRGSREVNSFGSGVVYDAQHGLIVPTTMSPRMPATSR